jgi:anhydro-N-acetylmuramic acid kinase
VNRIERLIDIARKEQRVIVGLMSGTSVDAIDAVIVRIAGHAPGAEIEMVRFESFPFPDDIRRRINVLFDRNKARVDEICHLDFVVGELFAAAAMRLIADAGMKAEDIDLIAVSGQTIWHRPRPTTETNTARVPWIGHEIATRSTLSIGQSAVIAERTGIITVGDLRVRDVAAGGHGAPLVSYFDWSQLRDAKKARAMQNIGGIATVTYVPADARIDDIIAFDTGPGNVISDSLTYIFSGQEETYDKNGERATRGQVREDVLQWCMSDPYFQLKPPKTTGRERFGRQFARRMAEKFTEVSGDDLIATATAFTAESAAHSYREFIREPIDEVIIAGGGARNPALLRMLRERLPASEVRVYEYLQEKEAMAMALIANDSIAGMATNAPSLTGGRPTILGKILL